MPSKLNVVDPGALPRKLFIGGEWVDAVEGGTIDVQDRKSVV